MYSVLNTFSEYAYFYISKEKNITSYIFFLVFKIVESLQCILKESRLRGFFSNNYPMAHQNACSRWRAPA